MTTCSSEGVASAFAEAVDGHADGVGSALDGGDAVGGGHAENVVSVEVVLQAGREAAQAAEESKGLERVPAAEGIGDANAISTVGGGEADEAAHEGRVGTRGVLRADRDLGKAAAGVGEQLGKRAADPLGVAADGAHLERREREGNVDRVESAGGGEVEIFNAGTAPRGKAHGQAHSDKRAEVAAFGFTHGGNAALNFGHADGCQLARDGQLFGGGKDDAGGLLAVAQRAVDDPDCGDWGSHVHLD